MVYVISVSSPMSDPARPWPSPVHWNFTVSWNFTLPPSGLLLRITGPAGGEPPLFLKLSL